MNENDNLVGNLIADARKKKKLTQQELAKLLNVSDKAVSAWETGKNYPDLGIIKNISKYLDVDLMSILVEKNNNGFKKFLKVILLLFVITFVICSFMFGIYFFSNYKKINVYSVKLDSKDYVLDSGIIVETPDKLIINFGDIKYNLDIKDDINVTLYYLDGNSKKEIISKFKYDYLDYECNNEYGKLENLILEISYSSDNKTKKVEVPIILEEKVNNDKFIYRKSKSELSESEERLKILLHNVGYKKSSDSIYIREYKTDNITYKFDIDKMIFSYVLVEDDLIKNGIYDINSDEKYFFVTYEDYTIEEFVYDEKVDCKLGKCKDSERMVKLLMDEYKKLK